MEYVCTADQPCEDCQRREQVADALYVQDRYRVALERIAGMPAFSPMDTAIRIAREALQ